MDPERDTWNPPEKYVAEAGAAAFIVRKRAARAAAVAFFMEIWVELAIGCARTTCVDSRRGV